MCILLIWTIAVRSPVFQMTYGHRILEILRDHIEKLEEKIREGMKELSPEELKEIQEELRKQGFDPDDFK